MHEERSKKIPRIVIYGSEGFEELIRRFKTFTGKCFPVLFSDPFGTGKTIAADIIAAELGLELYRADLSAIVSRHINETEKRMDHVFNAASSVKALLFFEEADALFGGRMELKDSHDRYANMELKYIMHKIGEYDGVVILATHHSKSIDEAFIRKMQFVVDFPCAIGRKAKTV